MSDKLSWAYFASALIRQKAISVSNGSIDSTHRLSLKRLPERICNFVNQKVTFVTESKIKNCYYINLKYCEKLLYLNKAFMVTASG